MATVTKEVTTKKEYVVRTKDLVKEFTMGGQTLRALKGIQLDIYKGEYISIMGPSGSGKSTLFNMVGGLDKPTTGTFSSTTWTWLSLTLRS